MLLPIMALLAAQAPAPSPPTTNPDQPAEIVVVAERLRRIRLVTHRDRRTGEWRCRIRRSSGDAMLDEEVCNASIACSRTETQVPGMNACMARRMPEIAERRRRIG